MASGTPERFQAYFIGALAVLLASLALLPSSVLQWAGNPDDLHFFGWFTLTGVCMAGTGEIRRQAHLRKNKWLLLFAIPPLAVLTYEAWFITRLAALGIIREWRGFFALAWMALTIYLWYRGNDYKEQAKWANSMLHRQSNRCSQCGAQVRD
jgi:hypothetical protein